MKVRHKVNSFSTCLRIVALTQSLWRYHAIAVTELIVPFSKLFTKQYSRCFCVTDDKISEWVMESVAVFWMVNVGME